MNVAYILRKVYTDGRPNGVQEDFIYKDNTLVNPQNLVFPKPIYTTDDLPEGKDNKYYTTERVKALVSAILAQALSNGNPNDPLAEPPFQALQRLKDAVTKVQTDLSNKADTATVDGIQANLAKLQETISHALNNGNNDVSALQTTLNKVVKDLESCVTTPELVSALSNKVTIEELAETLRKYASQTALSELQTHLVKANDRISKVEELLKAPNSDTLLQALNEKASKSDLQAALSSVNATISDIQQGLSGYATISYVRRLLEEVRVDTSPFATKDEVSTSTNNLKKEVNSSLEAIKDLIKKSETKGYVTNEDFNRRVQQELKLNDDKLSELATKDEVASLKQAIRPATTLDAGLMQAKDKEKLDNLPDGKLVALKDDVISVSKRVTHLEGTIVSPNLSNYATKQELDSAVTTIQGSIPKVNLTPYATLNYVDGKYSGVDTRLSVLEAKSTKPLDLTGYVTQETFNALANKVSTIVVPTLPDFNNFATKKALDDLSTQTSTAISGMSGKYVTADGFNSAYNALSDALNSRVTALATRLDTIQALKQTIPADVATKEQLTQASTTLQRQITAVETDLAAKSSGLSTSLSATNQRIDTLFTDLNAVNRKIAGIQDLGKAADLTSTLANLKDSVSTVETTVKAQGNTLNTLSTTLTRLEDRLPETGKLVSDTEMRSYVDSKSSSTKPATTIEAGVVRLAAESELSSPSNAVPTVANVQTLIQRTPIATNSSSGLMSYEQVNRLNASATQQELTNLSSTLQASIQSSVSDTNTRLQTLEQDKQRVESRITQLENNTKDTSNYATTNDLNSVKQEVEAVKALDRVTHKELEDKETTIKAEIASSTSDKLSALQNTVNSSITDLSRRIDKMPTSQVDLSTYAQRSELLIMEANIRKDFPTVPDVSNFVSTTVLTEKVTTLETKLTKQLETISANVENKATKEEVTALSNKVEGLHIPDTSNFATSRDLAALTERVNSFSSQNLNTADYATKTYLSEQLDTTVQTVRTAAEKAEEASTLATTASNKVKELSESMDLAPVKADVQGLKTSVSNLETKLETDYPTNTTLTERISGLSETYVRKEDLPKSNFTQEAAEALFLPKTALANYVQSEALEQAKTTILQTVSTEKQDVETKLTAKLNECAKTAEVQEKLAALQLKPKALKLRVQPDVPAKVDLSDYANKLVRITFLLHNEGEYQVSLNNVDITIDGTKESKITNATSLKAGARLLVEQKTLLVSSNTDCQISVSGSGISTVVLVEELY